MAPLREPYIVTLDPLGQRLDECEFGVSCLGHGKGTVDGGRPRLPRKLKARGPHSLLEVDCARGAAIRGFCLLTPNPLIAASTIYLWPQNRPF